MRATVLRLCLAVLAAIGATGAFAANRIALVVGNGTYEMPGMSLANPAADARAIARTLGDLGFDVDLKLDAGKEGMEDAVAAFVGKAREAEIALFYYAGHGLQDLGKNYLMPVDATLKVETDLRRRFMRLDDIIGDLAGTPAARIIILDACRDNEAVQALRAAVPKSRSTGISRGLAAVPKAAGMLVAFATQPDRVAADGSGVNSPFAQALVTHLGTPGVELRTALTRVRVEVARATGNAQVPEVSDSLLGELYLKPADAPPPVAQPRPAAPKQESPAIVDNDAWERENALWNAAQQVGTIETYEAYLKSYPKGHFAGIAQAVIARKKSEVAALPSQPRVVAPAALPPQQFAAPPPAALPPAAPPRPLPLEAQARAFVERINSDWSLDNGAALARMAETYGANVHFYGKTLPHGAVMDEKRKFAVRWPSRDYRVRPGSAAVQCWPEARSCSVTAIVDYAAQNPATGRTSRGASEYTIEIVFPAGGGQPRVVSEVGKTLRN